MAQQPKNAFTGDPKIHSDEKFKDGMTGSCLCGNITVNINDSELFTKKRGHLCHCSNCRKISGSYVASNLIIEKTAVEVKDPKGSLKKFEDWATGSGKKIDRAFCSNCGCPISSEPDAFPDKIVLKMGMFPRIPAPECESFAEHRHEWQGQHPDVVQFALVRGQKKLGEP